MNSGRRVAPEFIIEGSSEYLVRSNQLILVIRAVQTTLEHKQGFNF